MYEVITGERLFVHAGLTTSADEIYSQPVPSVSKKVPGLTPELDAIMQRALSIDPDKRYQTAGELNEALTRCAHRNGLLMSAPELAKELLETCGEHDQWRGDDDDDDLGYVPRAGTEVYDASDDEDDDDDGGPVSIHSIAAKANRSPTRSQIAAYDPRLSRPKTEIDKFDGVELTSIINMIDLEGGEGSQAPRRPERRPQARLRAAPPARLRAVRAPDLEGRRRDPGRGPADRAAAIPAVEPGHEPATAGVSATTGVSADGAAQSAATASDGAAASGLGQQEEERDPAVDGDPGHRGDCHRRDADRGDVGPGRRTARQVARRIYTAQGHGYDGEAG